MSAAINGKKFKLHQPYAVMLAVYAIFLAAAFVLDSPAEISSGLWRIITSRSVLVSDYAEVGGIGAMLVNAVLVGLFSIATTMFVGVKPGGAIFMAMWLNTGFAFFGKNLFNMLPLTFGVLLYAKIKKEPLINFSLVALLSATLSPVVSAVSFMDAPHPFVSLAAGVCVGIGAGFIFPVVSSYAVRAHAGYDLYNMGFAGGLISTFLVSVLKSVGVEVSTALEWSSGNNLSMACLLYVIAVVLLVFGIASADKSEIRYEFKKIMRQSGRLVSDFYIISKAGTCINMGILCIFATTLALILNFDLNGPVMGGILTIVGFGSFGKHLRNIVPILIGAILSTFINMWNPSMPSNSLAILFSTGLAPIAGQFGWRWGIAAGFLHVNLAIHIGYLNSGLNLYNNGYAAGFVALILIPIILAFGKEPANE